jgi:predicted phosphohydrolase
MPGLKLHVALTVVFSAVVLLLYTIAYLAYTYVSPTAGIIVALVEVSYIYYWLCHYGHAAFGFMAPHDYSTTLTLDGDDNSCSGSNGKVRFVVLSDTHGKHQDLKVPDADVLLHCGDFTVDGGADEIADFNAWLGTLPHKHKYVLAGNHDFDMDIAHESDEKQLNNAHGSQLLSNATYLHNSEAIVHGIRIYGCPFMPRNPSPMERVQAFSLKRGSEELDVHYSTIPDNTDILLTHSPPHGYGDRAVLIQLSVGCRQLLKRVQSVRPRFHVFGHIHEGYGVHPGTGKANGTTFINAANCNLFYKPKNKPIVFDIAV